MKDSRQKLILELISSQTVETQQQLLELLEQNGVRCTQATLSRDIHALGLVKQADSNGVIHYGVNPLTVEDNDLQRLLNVSRTAALSVEQAQNIIVIKTLPGLAGAVGSFVDKLDHHGLVGSIAGDDTILLVLKDNDVAAELLRVIQGMLSGKISLS